MTQTQKQKPNRWRKQSLQSLLDYTGNRPVSDAAQRAAVINALLLTVGVGQALREAKALYQAGNPWPYTEIQWGVCLTGEEYAGDDAERAEWDSGRRGRFFVLESYQREIHEAVASPMIRQVACKGASGVGKGASTGMSIVSYFDCWDDAKVVVTRDSYQTAVNIFLPEVVRWWMAARVPPPYRWGLTEVGTPLHFIRAANPRTNEGFSGCHGVHVLFVFDEATAIPQARWNMADTQAKKLVALGNPRFSFGPFRDMFRPAADPDKTQTVVTSSGLRRLITARGVDASNVRMERLDAPVAPPKGITIRGVEYKPGEPIRPEHLVAIRPVVPGQVDLAKYQSITGNSDPAFVAYMGHGQFPGEDREFTLFPRGGLDCAVDWWRRYMTLRNRLWWRKTKTAERAMDLLMPVQAFGLDVARSVDEDESCLSAGGRRGIRGIHTVQIRDTLGVTRWAIDTAKAAYGVDLTRGVIPVAVDGVGVGGGVVDALKARGVRVIEVMGGSAAEDSAKFLNKRAELAYLLSERLSMVGPFFGWQCLPVLHRVDFAGDERGIPFGLPDDPKLIEELSAIERVYGGALKEKLGITPKDGDDFLDKTVEPARVVRPLKKILGRSPDRADAAMLMMEAVRQAPADLSRWLRIL